jgi:hypothetical protein
MQPRLAHAKERFSIEATFEKPLPEGALLLAEFAGPIGPGGPALTFWTSSSGPVDGRDRSRIQLTGQVPEEAPPGLYRVTHLEVRWTADMPLSWEPAKVPLDAVGADVLIQVESSMARTQPAIPRLIAAG